MSTPATATPASKVERAAIDALGGEGWQPQGRDQHGHLVLRHTSGARMAVPKTPRNMGNALQHLAQRARRLVREQGSLTEQFLDHVCELYEVPAKGRKMVRFRMSEEVAAWKHRTPAARHAHPHTIADGARRHPRLEVVEQGDRGRSATWWLYGPAAVLEPPAGDGDVPEGEQQQRPANGKAKRRAPKGLLAEATEQAIRWLELYLKDGPRFAAQVKATGAKDGHTAYALAKAAKHLGVIYDKEPRRQGRTWWRLPGTEPAAGAIVGKGGSRPGYALAAGEAERTAEAADPGAVPDEVQGAPVTNPRAEPPQAPAPGETIHADHPKADTPPAPQAPAQPPLGGNLDAGLVDQLRQALLAQELATMSDLETRLGLAEETLVTLQGQAQQVQRAAAETGRHAKVLEDAAAGALALLRERQQLVLPATEGGTG